MDGTEKICARCGQAKPRSAFHKRRNSVQSYCKECRARDYAGRTDFNRALRMVTR